MSARKRSPERTAALRAARAAKAAAHTAAARRLTDANTAEAILRGYGTAAPEFRFGFAVSVSDLDTLSPRQRDLAERAIALFADCKALCDELEEAELAAEEAAEAARQVTP